MGSIRGSDRTNDNVGQPRRQQVLSSIERLHRPPPTQNTFLLNVEIQRLISSYLVITALFLGAFWLRDCTARELLPIRRFANAPAGQVLRTSAP
jgi:hypothetical protein